MSNKTFICCENLGKSSKKVALLYSYSVHQNVCAVTPTDIDEHIKLSNVQQECTSLHSFQRRWKRWLIISLSSRYRWSLCCCSSFVPFKRIQQSLCEQYMWHSRRWGPKENFLNWIKCSIRPPRIDSISWCWVWCLYYATRSTTRKDWTLEGKIE